MLKKVFYAPKYGRASDSLENAWSTYDRTLCSRDSNSGVTVFRRE